MTKLNPTGSGLVYSTYLGGSDTDAGNGIAVDGAGSAYVTGFTRSTDFPTTAGPSRRPTPATIDAFVTKLNAPAPGWSIRPTWAAAPMIRLGHRRGRRGQRLRDGLHGLDQFPDDRWAAQTTHAAAFRRLRDQAQRHRTGLVYSTYLGGSDIDDGRGIAVDGAGSAYVTGYTASTDFPTTAGRVQTTHAGGPTPS